MDEEVRQQPTMPAVKATNMKKKDTMKKAIMARPMSEKNGNLLLLGNFQINVSDVQQCRLQVFRNESHLKILILGGKIPRNERLPNNEVIKFRI